MSRMEWKFLATVLALYSFLLLYRIDRQSLWIDEIMTLDVVTRSWSDAWRFFVAMPEQHPFYYLLLWGWTSLLGTSEVALRSLSAVFAMGTAFVTYILAREAIGGKEARVCALLLCFSPYLLYYGQEARMYTLLAFLSVLGTLLVLRWSRGAGHGALVAYGAVAVLGVYTHFFYILLIAAHLAFVLIRNRGLRGPTMQLFAVQIGVGVLFLPWAALILDGETNTQDWKGVEHVVFGIPYTLLRFSIGYSEVLANSGWKTSAWTLLSANASVIGFAVLAFGPLAYLGVRDLYRRRGEDGALLLLFGLLVPATLALLLSAYVIVMGERYLIVSFPFFVVLLAAGLVRMWESIPTRVFPVLVSALLVMVVGRSLYRYYFDDEFGKEQWAEVADYLHGNALPSDLVVTYSGMTHSALAYYFHPIPGGPRVVRPEQVQADDSEAASRIWLVLSHPPENRELVARFGAGRDLKFERLYPKNSGIRVILLASNNNQVR